MPMPNFKAIYFGHVAYSVLLWNILFLLSLNGNLFDLTDVAIFIIRLFDLVLWLLEVSTLVAFLIVRVHALRFPESPFGIRFTALYQSFPGNAVLIPFCLAWGGHLPQVLIFDPSFRDSKRFELIGKFITLYWIHPTLSAVLTGIFFFPTLPSLMTFGIYLVFTFWGSCWFVMRHMYHYLSQAWSATAAQKYMRVPTQEGVDLEAMSSTRNGR